MWVDKGSQFYNRPIKSWFQDNDIEMHSTHNEDKSVIAERFIRILKNKIYKYMTSVLKMSILINQMIQLTNTAVHITIDSTIKMKPVDAKPNTYIDFYVENNDKNPKFEIGDHVRIFAKGYTPKLV